MIPPPPTAADLADMQRRVDAATPGPWRECGHDRGGCQCGLVWQTSAPPGCEPALVATSYADTSNDCPQPRDEQRRINATFIAAARTDVPVLLAALAVAQARVSALESAIRIIGSCGLCKGSGRDPRVTAEECPMCAGIGISNRYARAALAVDESKEGT